MGDTNQEIEKLKQEANSLGIHGLYRMLKKHEELLDRHYRAIDAFADGATYKACRIMRGYDN
ncbi:hypothetical protein [Chengkuizengella sediminis]|uniref:hypothetical protein n=1 Tax=Chengkuizengella sediminis TaxID=1885917 RepID=UPI001389EB4E|nr:hypothetical protein [Chengkuizengella sediminis]NDI33619.1 hypothetical protein [Chengkuizengella sediminis]